MPSYRLKRFDWSPVWYITWTEGRRSHRNSTGASDHEEAQRVLASFIIERGRIEHQSIENVTIASVLEDYYLGHAHKLASASVTRGIIDNLLAHYGTAPVYILSGHEGHTSYEKYCREQKVKNGTINRRRAVLKAALNFAAKNGRVATVPYVPLLVEGPPRPHFLSRAEAARLLWAARRLPHISLFIRIALYTGARQSAILQLTWDRIDFERGTIDFRLPGIEHRRKKRPVRPVARRLIDAMYRHYRRTNSENVIIWNGSPIRSVKIAFRTLRRTTGLPVTAHVLKHTAISWALQAATIWEVSQLTATSIKTIERVYAKPELEHLRAAAERTARGGARNLRARPTADKTVRPINPQ